MKETWVIKIGSSLITKSSTGLNIKNIKSWASQINELVNRLTVTINQFTQL